MLPPSSNIAPPCMRLNDDVLQEIFIHLVCFLDDISLIVSSNCFILYKNYKCRHSIRALPQLTVSQVCSSWRHVALLTPQLWDNILINEWTEANIRIAKEYLSRAANLPISIQLNLSSIEIADWRSQVIDFLSSYRIRFADIPNFQLILPDLPQRSIADLEVLELINWKGEDEKEQIDLNDTRYPKLAVIRIDGIWTITGSSSSLCILDGTRLIMTIIEGWDLLTRCPLLEECLLTITRGNSSWPVPVPRIHLRHLYVLALYNYRNETPQDPESINIFMEALALPVIEELHVTCGRCDRLPMTALQSLARQSNHFPHLTQLKLSFTYPTVIVDIGALLALTPSLTSISLGYYISSAIFDVVTLNGLASGSLAPLLKYLELGKVSNSELFMDMVESRMENAQTSSNGVPALLKRVRLSVRDGYESDRLKDMQQRGIPIYPR